LRLGRRYRTIAGRSAVHGWGVFAAESIPKNVLIGEYVGEIISQDEAERRGRVYDELDYSFLFNITEHYAVDSTRLGSKLKYCNHSPTPNCEPRLMRVGGDVRVGIYSKQDIASLEELFFDYGYHNGPEWAMQGKLPMQGTAAAKSRAEFKKRKRSSMKESAPSREVDEPPTHGSSANLRLGRGRDAKGNASNPARKPSSGRFRSRSTSDSAAEEDLEAALNVDEPSSSETDDDGARSRRASCRIRSVRARRSARISQSSIDGDGIGE
jgi:histone-lysine N-methyltransferase EZH2